MTLSVMHSHIYAPLIAETGQGYGELPHYHQERLRSDTVLVSQFLRRNVHYIEPEDEI